MKRFGVLLLLALPLCCTAALFDGCDNVFNIQAGYSYLQSPYFPNLYPASTSCRYRFVAPQDYYITLNCSLEMHKNGNACSGELFYVSTDGDPYLRGSEQFCGTGTFVRSSLFRSITLAYVTNELRGRFECSLYVQKQNCDCGWSVTQRIVNGEQANINEFPSVVALINKQSTSLFCGGAIVSHRYIVTAAHCTRMEPVASNIIAFAGDHDLSSSSESMFAAQYPIQQIIEHSGYTSDPVANDIALLKTVSDIDWSRGVGPICLPPAAKAQDPFTYSTVFVTGWGTKFFGGPTSSTLQKIQLMVTSNEACQNSYQGVTIINDGEICAYDYSGKKRDSCQFDSGGPVILRNARSFILGIISFGKICGVDAYAIGVNTRITAYLQWIYQNTGYSTCNVAM